VSSAVAEVVALSVGFVVPPGSGGHGSVGFVVVSAAVVVVVARVVEVDDERVVEVAPPESSSLLHAARRSSPAATRMDARKMTEDRRTARL